ncbi:hypothetical protein FHX41_2184 [Actinomadura hallensis]|uniref:Uncharacterized protein n=1 Tax=Actinomadura hallensis TaxID=337895 RepID=A0A543ID97_9ACTN|nr:hypothetical protein [Actinomadura hallensis]TQM68537.1 hypothetical protein FHX41_2184 [Actinomadura hallensis]
MDDTVSFTMKSSGRNSWSSVQICHPDEGCVQTGGGGYSSGGDDQSVQSGTAWTAGAGARILTGKIVITVLSVADGSAILRVRPN